ncbi:MAG TPA: hypothetical protein PKE69_11900 [Pyrinomonadaceae bacterium]|nr:hypothetical protein [Pyrinomonadaceae bacterium]
MNNNEKVKEKWLKTREEGKFHYIFINGVLFWGFFHAMVFYLLQLSFGYVYDYQDFRHLLEHFWFHLLLFFIIVAPFFGLGSWLLWNKREKEFARNMDEK